MSDVDAAKRNLGGHTLVLCKNDSLIFSDKHGIMPMVEFIAAHTDLTGYSAADLIVGKAAAMLFVKAGIKEVYAATLSEGGKKMLEDNGIAVSYGVLTDKIINREKTDVCPMERAVSGTDDVEEGYRSILEKIKLLKLG